MTNYTTVCLTSNELETNTRREAHIKDPFTGLYYTQRWFIVYDVTLTLAYGELSVCLTFATLTIIIVRHCKHGSALNLVVFSCRHCRRRKHAVIRDLSKKTRLFVISFREISSAREHLTRMSRIMFS